MKESVFKSLVHFFVGAPATISLFLGGTEYLKAFSIEDAKKNIEDKFAQTFKVAFCYWPFIYYICYQFIPRHIQNPVNDIFAVFYAVILSHINSQVKV